jgi:hypothetical protein
MGGGGGFNLGGLLDMGGMTFGEYFGEFLGGQTLQGDWAGINAEIPGGTGGVGMGGMLGGAAGGLLAQFLAPMLFKQGQYSGIGGGLGSLGGMALAGALSFTGPVGMGIGALLGGLGGNFLGGMLGGGGPSSGELGWMQFQANIEKLKDLPEGEMDLSTYLDTFRQFHQSDNRAAQAGWSTESIEQLMREKMGDEWKWWMPTAQLVGGRQDFEGTQNEDYWKRATTGGLWAEAFGGEEGTDWASNNLEKINEILKDLPIESVEAMGESLTTIKDGAGMFGVTLQDLFKDITDGQLASGEWADILKDRLQPASLMARMEDELRAKGLNELEVASAKVATAIDTLLGSFNMGEEDTDAWIRQLMEATAGQADMAAKMKEYEDIVKKLQNAHELDEDEIRKLVERGRALREELGLGESQFSGVEEAVKTLTDTLSNELTPAILEMIKQLRDAVGGDNNNNNNAHRGGQLRGGKVFRAHSGVPVPMLPSSGHLAANERWVKVLDGEGFIPPDAMSKAGPGQFELARTGQWDKIGGGSRISIGSLLSVQGDLSVRSEQDLDRIKGMLDLASQHLAKLSSETQVVFK